MVKRSSAPSWTAVHNLLSVTGEHTEQPLVSRDGSVWVLFNGELYNWRELGRSLGQAAPLASDAAVILPALVSARSAC